MYFLLKTKSTIEILLATKADTKLIVKEAIKTAEINLAKKISEMSKTKSLLDNLKIKS